MNLEFVKEFKYLGVLIKSEEGFFCSGKKPRTAFYRSSNSVLNVIKKPSQPVLMELLYTICAYLISRMLAKSRVIIIKRKSLYMLHSMMPLEGYFHIIDGRALRVYVKVLAINPLPKSLLREKQNLKRDCPPLVIKHCWLSFILRLFFFYFFLH